MRRNRFRLSSPFENRKSLIVRICAAAGMLPLSCSRQSVERCCQCNQALDVLAVPCKPLQPLLSPLVQRSS